jgi:acyl-ACP thioesterase
MQEYRCGTNPSSKKQRCNADNASVLENTSSYNMLLKVFDLSLATHNLKRVQEVTNILVTELNTLHQALDSNMHLEIVMNNDPISIVIPMSGSKESSNTSDENEVR